MVKLELLSWQREYLFPLNCICQDRTQPEQRKELSFGEGSVRQQCKHKGLCGRTFLVEKIMVEIPYEAVERKS